MQAALLNKQEIDIIVLNLGKKQPKFLTMLPKFNQTILSFYLHKSF